MHQELKVSLGRGAVATWGYGEGGAFSPDSTVSLWFNRLRLCISYILEPSKGLISRISSLHIYETDRFILLKGQRTIGHGTDFSNYKEFTAQNWVPFKSSSKDLSDDIRNFRQLRNKLEGSL